MINENIYQFPDTLERLADKLADYLKRDTTNRKERVEILEGICLTLVEARDKFTADIEFGQWCEINGFGLNHQTRAAAIAMGREPEALRRCLEQTDRKSLEAIHRFDFPRFTNFRKPITRRNSSRKQPKRDKARDAIDALKVRGKPVTRKAVSEEAGVGENTALLAMQEKNAVVELSPLTPGEMRKTMLKRYELAVKKARLEIREEIRDEVFKELDASIKRHKERVERADRILAAYKGVMSHELFRRIRACLHPDVNTFTHAAEALREFSKLESVLVKPPERPQPSGPPLPETVADLMARRRTRTR